MKKEELFDLLGEVDDNFIEEAMLDDFDNERGVRVRPGKTRAMPLKIAAGTAACLAVFAAAGLIYANRGKLGFAPASSPETADTSFETSAALSPEDDFIKQCKAAVTKESDAISGRDDAVWETRMLDIDCDGSDELLLHPTTDGYTVPDIGVRVFKNSADGIQDLGRFAVNCDKLELDEIYKSEKEGDNNFYYRFSHSTNAVKLLTIDGIRTVSYSEMYQKLVEEDYLRLETTYHKGGDPSLMSSEKAYCCHEEIGVDELLRIWEQFPQIPAPDTVYKNDLLPKMFKVLKEKYNISDDLGELPYRTSLFFDIDSDGSDNEIILRFDDVPQLNGIYIFYVNNSEPELVGDFETGASAEISDIGGKEQFWFYSVETKTEFVFKTIVKNSDGTFTSKPYLAQISDENATHYELKGQEISEEKYNEELRKFVPDKDEQPYL